MLPTPSWIVLKLRNPAVQRQSCHPLLHLLNSLITLYLSLHMNYVYLANAKDRKKTQVLKPFSVSIFPPLRKFDCLTQEVISNFPDESCLF